MSEFNQDEFINDIKSVMKRHNVAHIIGDTDEDGEYNHVCYLEIAYVENQSVSYSNVEEITIDLLEFK